MSEFWRDPNFWIGVFVAIIVGISGFISLYRWKKYSKPVDMDVYFITNPNQSNESTTNSLTIPNKTIFNSPVIIYLKLSVKDDREYVKPYIKIYFPPMISIWHDLPYHHLRHGRNITLIDPNGLRLVFDEMLSKNKEPMKFPIVIKMSSEIREYQIKILLGADNILNGKPIQRELKLITTNERNQLSHEERLFDRNTFYQ